MATITARVDDEMKVGLQQFADEMGTTVGGLITMMAKKVLRSKQFVLGYTDDELEEQEIQNNKTMLVGQFSQAKSSGRSDFVL